MFFNDFLQTIFVISFYIFLHLWNKGVYQIGRVTDLCTRLCTQEIYLALGLPSKSKLSIIYIYSALQCSNNVVSYYFITENKITILSFMVFFFLLMFSSNILAFVYSKTNGSRINIEILLPMDFLTECFSKDCAEQFVEH